MGNTATEPSPKHNIEKDLEDFIYEPLTSGGCPRSRHIELTLGIGKFESRVCPACKLEVYKP